MKRRENPAVVGAILLEQAILKELKKALVEEWRGRRRGPFMTELRQQIRTQAFRIAALRRMKR